MVEDRYLQHMREPSAPAERKTTPSAQLDDFEALYFQRVLREYALYYGDDEYSGIAGAYVEYIDERVRDNGAKWIDVYAHTHEARHTLFAALDQSTVHPSEMADLIEVTLTELWTEPEGGEVTE